jgi:virginiamycin B lyase
MTTSGALTEYAIPSFEALSITAGPDGALWFTETDSGKIGRMTTSGAVTEYTIPPTTSVPAGVSAAPSGITSGPDGALWFKATAMVGRLTTAGAFTLFTISKATSGPEAIASGPDGALWFTEDNDNSKIGRITP